MGAERQDVGKLRLLLVGRGAAQIGHPVIEEIVGLGFQRVGADGDDGVGELGIFIAIVDFANAYIAGGMNL